MKYKDLTMSREGRPERREDTLSEEAQATGTE